MRRSWLIQRLEKPLGNRGLLGPDNPFAFGGGLKNGGLSDEAMGLLRDIFSFEYMGAAEFEFGAVPQALQGLANAHDRLTAGSFEVPLSQVSAGWRRDAEKVAATGQASVYFIAPAEWAEEVELRIRTWAKEGFRSELKETTNLASTLRPSEDFHGRTVGWLELDNGFMFFTDEQMWLDTAALFGVVTA
jgi:hypothetical protein